ncbi:hypothetical protein AC579_3680 [Pseudocercospora musae]|uniref:SET domain-containing protein n=1 Tax=Pseudocercospora musae TaxID=113226 RepID=A0A139IIT3_9PEZI|nr:hypothetical protein AC579_3680 [Pseudocercospora musae]
MLVQRGKAEGWLHLNVAALTTWAIANGIEFKSASPAVVPGRGVGLLADRPVQDPSSDESVFLTISEDLVLSIEAVKRHALFDRDFRELIESLDDFGRTLPCELLPIFWSPEELQLLVGTTLAPAVSAKLKSLRREYDLVCESAARTRWYSLVEGLLSFEDWKHVDSMFRSRALDFYGSCMIPGMDLASHAAGDGTIARYDREDGRYFLRLIEGKSLEKGQEVTITYGDEKGACEMLFSYGFIDDSMDTAETLFLSLSIQDSDPSRAAKLKVADCAPGFKIIDVVGSGTADDESNIKHEIDWKGDFVWLLCAGEEEGLRFELARTLDQDEPELQATFRGIELKHGASDLRRHLAHSDLWPVYRLRAVVILQQRVFDQMQLLYSTQEDFDAVPHGDAADVRSFPYASALKLRRLEFELLEKAYGDFERQVR